MQHTTTYQVGSGALSCEYNCGKDPATTELFRSLNTLQMTTKFSSLPVVDVGLLASPIGTYPEAEAALSKRLYEVFATTGFAYLTDIPLSFKHEDVFNLSRQFFALPIDQKMMLARRSFNKDNENTYRGSLLNSRSDWGVLTNDHCLKDISLHNLN